MIEESLNLTVQRGPTSVWDKPGWQVQDVARPAPAWLIASGGLLLGLYGAGRRGRMRAFTTLAGSGLIAWAVLGGGRLQRVWGYMGRAWLPYSSPHDEVGQASDDSFPASDAPAWTSAAATGTKPLGRTAADKPESTL